MHFLKKIIFLLLFIISFSCQTRLEKQGWQRTAIGSHWDSSTIKKDKELIVEKRDHNGSYYYSLTFFGKDPTGKIINKPFGGFVKPFNSDIAYYKWESDSICLVKLLNQGNVQFSLKYIEYNDSSSSFGILDEPRK